MPQYEEKMKKLLKMVTRTFYEPQHVIIMDILLESTLLSDSDFCERMRMLNKEFNKLVVRLKDDKLIKSDIKVENKAENQQNVKSVYFINYAESRDVIKYKLFKMTKLLQVNKRAVDEAFFCPACDRCFTALEAQGIVENFVFKCLFCKGELQEKTIGIDCSGIDLKEAFHGLGDIIELLKEVESMEIPSIDYFQVVEIKKEKPVETATETETPMVEVEEKYSGEDNSSEFNNSVVLDKEANDESTDPKMRVDGKYKLFSEITKEDQEVMNEEEYMRYFEIYSKRQ